MTVRLRWPRIAVAVVALVLSIGLFGYTTLVGTGGRSSAPARDVPAVGAQDRIDIIEAAVVHGKFSSRLDGSQPGKQSRRNLSVLLEDRSVTVCRRAGDEPSCESLLSDELLEWEGLDPRINLDLRRRLAIENRVSTRHPASARAVLRPVASRDISRLLEGSTDGWSKFHQAYPNSAGFVKATVPVLSHSRMWALVYVEHSCGWRCGSGSLFLLMRSPEGWQVVVTDGVMMV